MKLKLVATPIPDIGGLEIIPYTVRKFLHHWGSKYCLHPIVQAQKSCFKCVPIGFGQLLKLQNSNHEHSRASKIMLWVIMIS